MDSKQATKERPIIFSGPMVRAILDGSKTQTRRVVKPQPAGDIKGVSNVELSGVWYDRKYWLRKDHPGTIGTKGFTCPYGKPGDRLWVREACCLCSCGRCGLNPAGGKTSVDHIAYKATDQLPRKSAWRPSIHMPRWASRITLEVTDVRVERLQEISEADAIAEGVTRVSEACHVIRGFGYDKSGLCHSHAITPFMQLWDSINAKTHPWESNPWVWAITFTKIGGAE